MGASVGPTLAVLVVEETLSGITGATGIKTAVLTKKYINEVHEMIVNVFVLRRRFAPCCGEYMKSELGLWLTQQLL